MAEQEDGFRPIFEQCEYVDVLRYATDDDIDPLVQVGQLDLEYLIHEASSEVSKILPTSELSSQLHFVSKSINDYVRNAQQLRICDDVIVNLQPGIDIMLQKLRERRRREYDFQEDLKDKREK